MVNYWYLVKMFDILYFIQVDADFYDEEQCDSIGSYTTEICGGIVHRIPLEVHVFQIIHVWFLKSNFPNVGCDQTIFLMLYIYINEVRGFRVKRSNNFILFTFRVKLTVTLTVAVMN